MAENETTRRRPLSNLRPGRKTDVITLLAQAGEEDDNSYRNMPTESDRSQGNRSASGRDVRNFLSDSDLASIRGDVAPISESVRSIRSDPNDSGIGDEEEEGVRPPPPKKRRVTGMILEKRAFFNDIRSINNRYPVRNRIPPVRWWLGEEPIYKWEPEGGGVLEGVTDVIVRDKMYMKYKTASPVILIEKQLEERKKQSGKKSRKRTYSQRKGNKH